MPDLPKAICGYPIEGWRLQRVEFDDGRAGRPVVFASAWEVELCRERAAADYGGCGRILARSHLGPLEAWDDAVARAARDNEEHPFEKRDEAA